MKKEGTTKRTALTIAALTIWLSAALPRASAYDRRFDIERSPNLIGCERKGEVLQCRMNVSAWKNRHYNLAEPKSVAWVKFQHHTMAWVVEKPTLELLERENCKRLRLVAYKETGREDKYGNRSAGPTYRVAEVKVSRATLSKVNFESASQKEAIASLRDDLSFVRWSQGFVQSNYNREHF